MAFLRHSANLTSFRGWGSRSDVLVDLLYDLRDVRREVELTLEQLMDLYMSLKGAQL